MHDAASRRSLRTELRLEVAIAVRTFLVAWGILGGGLFLYGVLASDHSFGDAIGVLLTFTVGLAQCLFYVFWPAVLVAGCRVVHRLVGLAAFVPLPVIAAGIVVAFWVCGGLLRGLFNDVLELLAAGGQCGGHAGGAVIILSLICLLFGLMTPAGLWTMAKLLVAIVLVFILGSAPGIGLWFVLVARALYRKLARSRSAAAGAARGA